MMQINGRITTVHGNAQCVASALTPDNLTGMTTTAEGDRVTMILTGTQIRSVIASMDDYLMNLAIAEDACSSFSHIPSVKNTGTCQTPGSRHGKKTGVKKK
jgi:hypothetical protein